MHPQHRPFDSGQVREMLAQELPTKKGAKLALYHLESPLMLHQTLQEQGFGGNTVRLSCTAPMFQQTYMLLGVTSRDSDLDGVTETAGWPEHESLSRLPQSLERLTLSPAFDQSLEQVTLPTSLKSLTFGELFNHSLERVPLPSKL